MHILILKWNLHHWNTWHHIIKQNKAFNMMRVCDIILDLSQVSLFWKMIATLWDPSKNEDTTTTEQHITDGLLPFVPILLKQILCKTNFLL